MITQTDIVKDHPRLRGKNRINLPVNDFRLGSPPLAREKLDSWKQRKPPSRITPACAGKTPFGSGQAAACRDHPRLRGKNVPFSSISVLAAGSPPLAREKPSGPVHRVLEFGITPACAGKTLIRSPRMLAFSPSNLEIYLL